MSLTLKQIEWAVAGMDLIAAYDDWPVDFTWTLLTWLKGNGISIRYTTKGMVWSCDPGTVKPE